MLVVLGDSIVLVLLCDSIVLVVLGDSIVLVVGRTTLLTGWCQAVPVS